MKPEDIDKLFRAKLENHQGAPQLPAWGRLEKRLQQPKAEHPVDELFRRKLENHPTPLPENLWARLQARLNGTETKNRPMWVWYAAACIGLLLSVAGLWKLQLNKPEQLAANTEIATPQTAGTPAEKAPQAIQHPQTEHLAQVNSQNSEPTDNQATVAAPANQPKTQVTRRQEKTQTPQPAQYQNQLAVIAPKAATPKQGATAITKAAGSEGTPANQPEKSLALPTDETKPVVIGSSPQLAVAEPLKVDIILTAEQQVQEQNTANPEEQERGSFAKRVAKNLLKLKNGEKPDLQELGLAQSYTMHVQTKSQTLSKTINL